MEHGTSVQQQKVMENHTENISLKMAKLEDNTEKLDRLKEGKVSLFFFSFYPYLATSVPSINDDIVERKRFVYFLKVTCSYAQKTYWKAEKFWK